MADLNMFKSLAGSHSLLQSCISLCLLKAIELANHIHTEWGLPLAIKSPSKPGSGKRLSQAEAETKAIGCYALKQSNAT